MIERRVVRSSTLAEPGATGWTVGAILLFAFAVLVAGADIAALPDDDTGIVSMGLWYFGLPLAGAGWIIGTAMMVRARRLESARGRRVSRLLPWLCVVAAVLLATAGIWGAVLLNS